MMSWTRTALNDAGNGPGPASSSLAAIASSSPPIERVIVPVPRSDFFDRSNDGPLHQRKLTVRPAMLPASVTPMADVPETDVPCWTRSTPLVPAMAQWPVRLGGLEAAGRGLPEAAGPAAATRGADHRTDEREEDREGRDAGSQGPTGRCHGSTSAGDLSRGFSHACASRPGHVLDTSGSPGGRAASDHGSPPRAGVRPDAGDATGARLVAAVRRASSPPRAKPRAGRARRQRGRPGRARRREPRRRSRRPRRRGPGPGRGPAD